MDTRLTERLLFLLCCSCLKKSRAAENRSFRKQKQKIRREIRIHVCFRWFSEVALRTFVSVREKIKRGGERERC